jgi:hypothetical protein
MGKVLVKCAIAGGSFWLGCIAGVGMVAWYSTIQMQLEDEVDFDAGWDN